MQEMEPPPVVVPVGSRLEIAGAELEEITKVCATSILCCLETMRRGLWCSPARSQKMVAAGCVRGWRKCWPVRFWHGCLVDANLRSPGLNAQFATENAYGLTDALRKREPIRSFAQPLSCPRCGWSALARPPKMGKALLSSDRMRERMTETQVGIRLCLDRYAGDQFEQ